MTSANGQLGEKDITRSFIIIDEENILFHRCLGRYRKI